VLFGIDDRVKQLILSFGKNALSLSLGMGRIKQKGKSGAAKAYITRSSAVRRLQCSLADFRRLCILKGDCHYFIAQDPPLKSAVFQEYSPENPKVGRRLTKVLQRQHPSTMPRISPISRMNQF